LLQLESQIDKFKADLSKKETDFMELRKSNSKLKVRVDDTNRENTDLKRERDNLRRDVVQMKNDLADQEYERIADRQRLEGAKLEAQQYKAKLDRMVDAKVTKRSDQKLKCF
jgi:kinesin family protein 4/21/27